MSDPDQSLTVYRELADHYDRLGKAQLRDRFLVLATDAAFEGGQPAEAEQLRRRLLQRNPHHMLKPFASYPEALRSADVQAYVKGLRQDHPAESAATLLESLRSGKTDGDKSETPHDPADDLFLPLGEEPDDRDEPLKVYRLEEPKQRPAPTPSRPAPAPKKVPAAAPPKPSPTLRRSVPSPTSAPFPLRPLPLAMDRQATRRRESGTAPDADVATGAFVASALYLLVAAAGLGLLCYTLARPFLPANWLP